MKVLSNLVIELYRAAQEMAVDEFREFSFGLLKLLVPFDTAVYGKGTLVQQGLIIQECYLHKKPPEILSDYAAITHEDPVLKVSRANLGKVIRFHPPTLFGGKDKRPVFDYAMRYEHANGMSTVQVEHDSADAQMFSMWRADEDNHFLARDSLMAEQVLPHLLEALKVNQALAVHSSVNHADRSTIAIAHPNGVLHFCGSGFRKLLNMDWPDWESAILPNPLMDELNRVGSTGHCSANIRVSVKCVGNLLFLKACKTSGITPCLAIHPDMLRKAYGLTVAEARVAIAMLEGRTAKEMAIYLKVSPHTVRTQIRYIYSKLGVNTRARFDKLMYELAQ